MKFIKLNGITTAIFASLLSATSTSVMASTESESDSSKDVEKIVVVGSKMSENYNEIPAAVSVISAETIEKLSLTTLRDIGRFAPNVSISQIGQVGGTFISIRGIESNPFNVSRTAIYIDGIPYRDPDMMRLSNVEQIEVLRGPQSTLYGANASAGVIVVSTKAPTEGLAGNVNLRRSEFANGKSMVLDGNIATRVSDKLSVYANLEVEKGDSFVKNIASSVGLPGELKNVFANAKLRYEMDEDTTINFVVTHNELDAPGLYEQEFPAFHIDKYNNNPIYGSIATGKTVGEFEIAHDAPKRTHEKDTAIALSLDKVMGDYQWISSLSLREEKDSSLGTDLDLSASPMMFAAGGHDFDNQYINAETRLSFLPASGLKWLVGANINVEDKQKYLRTAGSTEGGFDAYQTSPPQNVEMTNYSLFGQVIYPITDALKVTAGLRYDHVKSDVTQTAGTMIVGSLPPFTYLDVNETVTDKEWLPKVSAHYQVNDSTSFYASAAKGYLPGGYNLVSANEAAVNEITEQYGSYDPETLWTYEVGSKSSFLDDRLLVSGAIFFTDADAWQENFIVTTESGAVSSTTLIVTNAAIESKGAELEVMLKATDALSISANLGVTDAQYSSYDYDGTASYTGNKVKLIPEYDANLSIDYSISDAISFTAQVRGVGKTMLEESNAFERDAMVLTDFNLRYQADQWNVNLFVNNVTNERYASGLAYRHFFGNFFGDDGTYYAPLGAPRVVGVELGFNF